MVTTIREMLRNNMEFLVAKIRASMVMNFRNASGNAVKSLSYTMNGNDRATLYGAWYYHVMERGRRPGKVPYRFRDIIKQWILDKGIRVRPIPAKTSRATKSPYERGLDSMAGAIAYNIMTKGTRLHRTKGFDDIYTSAIEETVKRFGNQLPITVGAEIESINKRFVKENYNGKN